ncbi:precorrin-2 C(20)-methyltransferase [Flammeovirga pacifica]|uniref:Precorrin-2 C(20)-methyltransferase n=1 Tax=Flammeovirga pacifica TaxID=915059 RepID=A0A1S1YXZ1_FLAPC|nr:precorrin-2 C(20)-methyltransferase [Flammeovirga pacifica]OHX65868.1 precorrin-2 C(20)-methyltransferase [Flammeovirga pacifica]
MENTTAIYGVSLGPGDPDLITVKGLKTLKKVDLIYYPGSIFSDGKKQSYSLKILEGLNIDSKKLRGFYMKMTMDRQFVHSVYDETCQNIISEVTKGKKIAIVCEGDLSTYSSFSYLLERFQKHQLQVTLIPGITSFHLGASESQTPLALLNETIKILPFFDSRENIEKVLEETNTIILMKIKSVMHQIIPMLKENNLSFTYCEALGTPQQFMTSSLDDLKDRKVPYFSLMIIKNTRI